MSNAPTTVIKELVNQALLTYEAGDVIDGWDLAARVELVCAPGSKARIKFNEMAKTSKSRTKGHIVVFYTLHSHVMNGELSHIKGVNQGYLVK